MPWILRVHVPLSPGSGVGVGYGRCVFEMFQRAKLRYLKHPQTMSQKVRFEAPLSSQLVSLLACWRPTRYPTTLSSARLLRRHSVETVYLQYTIPINPRFVDGFCRVCGFFSYWACQGLITVLGGPKGITTNFKAVVGHIRRRT